MHVYQNLSFIQDIKITIDLKWNHGSLKWFNETWKSGPTPLLWESKTMSLHYYSKGMWVPFHFSHETEELLSSQQATSRQEVFWASLKQEETHWKPVTVKAVACAGIRLSRSSQGTRKIHSVVHPPVVPHPITSSCVNWLTVGEAATAECRKDASSEILGFKEEFEKWFSWKISLKSYPGA